MRAVDFSFFLFYSLNITLETDTVKSTLIRIVGSKIKEIRRVFVIMIHRKGINICNFYQIRNLNRKGLDG